MRKAEGEQARAHSATLERNVKDAERQASEAGASLAKQLRTVQEKASAQCLEMEKRLRQRYGLKV